MKIRLLKRYKPDKFTFDRLKGEYGIYATDYSQMQVEGVEDNWIIEGLDTGKTELWHNNYVKTGFRERYITEGFHKQNVEN